MPETTKKSNKTVGLVLGILAALILIFAGVYYFFGPKTVEGDKTVTIEVIDNEEKTTTYTVHTDAEFLHGAMEDAEGLTFSGGNGQFGLMIDTINGIRADFNKDGAYWSFYVGDEYCMSGIDEQPIEDGGIYRIIYTPAN